MQVLCLLIGLLVIGATGYVAYRFGAKECRHCKFAHPSSENKSCIFCEYWCALNNEDSCCSHFTPILKDNKK